MPLGPMKTKAQKRAGVQTVMHEYKHGQLHSGSKKGPVVKSRAQAIAIALKQTHQSKYAQGGPIDPFDKYEPEWKSRSVAPDLPGDDPADLFRPNVSPGTEGLPLRWPKGPLMQFGGVVPLPRPDPYREFVRRSFRENRPAVIGLSGGPSFERQNEIFGEELQKEIEAGRFRRQFGGAVPGQGQIPMTPGAGQMQSPMMPAAGGPSYPGNWPSTPFNQQLNSFTPYASMNNQLGMGQMGGMGPMGGGNQPLNMQPIMGRNPMGYQLGGPVVAEPPVQTPAAWELPGFSQANLSAPVGRNLEGFGGANFEHRAGRPVPLNWQVGLRHRFQMGGAVDDEPLIPPWEGPARSGLGRLAGPTVTSTVPERDLPPPVTNRAGETFPTFAINQFGRGLRNLAGRAVEESGKAVRGEEFDPGVTLRAASLANMPVPSPARGGEAALGTLYMFPNRRASVYNWEPTSTRNYDLVRETGETLTPLRTSQRGKQAHVDWIGDFGLVNQVGPRDVRSLLRAMRVEYPEAETVGGFRISGARTGRSADTELRLPRLTPEQIQAYQQEKAGIVPRPLVMTPEKFEATRRGSEAYEARRDARRAEWHARQNAEFQARQRAYEEENRRLEALQRQPSPVRHPPITEDEALRYIQQALEQNRRIDEGVPASLRKIIPERQFGGGLPYSARQGMFQFARQGMVASSSPGRGDHIGTRVRGGSYIIPADIVSAAGQGNSLAGAKGFDRMLQQGPYTSRLPKGGHNRFGGVRMMKMKQFQMGGPIRSGVVPVALSGGEYIVEPESASQVGRGDIDHGHDILDEVVRQIRRRNVRTLASLPGPKGAGR